MNDSSSEESLPCAPTEETAQSGMGLLSSLTSKSRAMYETAFENFVTWKKSRQSDVSSEKVLLLYFDERSQKYKPSSLWATYSMLKSTIKIHENVDISSYEELLTFLKNKSKGFRSQKSNVLEPEDIHKFLTEAPDREYLATKVALIFGISGACRGTELTQMEVGHIAKHGKMLLVNIPDTNVTKPRTFTISDEFFEYVHKYRALRPEAVPTNRFFLNYQKGKCTKQVIGKHKFSKMPKDIADFLELPDPETYTGHSFRRTSAVLRAGSRSNLVTLKRHISWKSSNVEKKCIANSVQDNVKVEPFEQIILPSVNFPKQEPEEQSETALSKRQNTNVTLNLGTTSTVNEVSSDKNIFNFQNCNITIHTNKLN